MSTQSLIVWTVIDIVALIAGLAVYLFIVGTQLTRVANNLEDAADLVWAIKKDAEPIAGGLTMINNTGGIVAGALPLLYGMGEGIVAGATFNAEEAHAERKPAYAAMGTRRSRLFDGVGVAID
ncbi:MAG: hypothetical protein F2839_05720 [Actinobacteria bacterium]|uniref:Unannotated protein n=1 Tax=freshwater metagenome TaxID=449393 RepID=A0A6J5ZNX9_9ZZZZ|nr:hypothetical protein [Actinomycetota bacterium]